MYRFTNYLLGTMLLALSLLVFNTENLMAQDPDPCVEGGYVLSVSATPVSCAGDETGVAVVASTGCSCVFSGCTFLWNNGETHHTIDSLSAGVYSVTITHPNGCILDTSMVVTSPDGYVQDVQAQGVSCYGNNDGTASVVPSATAGPLTYLWSNGATTESINGVAGGAYTVTVTNYINCEYIATTTITEPPEVQLDVIAHPSCGAGNTGAAEVVVLGGAAPFNYLWNDPNNCIEPAAQQLAPGAYTVSVTDANNCLYTRTIEVASSPMATVAVLTTSACTGLATGTASAEVMGATGPFSYSWSNGQTATTASFLQVGSYAVTITDANGCSYENDFTIEPQSLGINASVSAAEVCAGESVSLFAQGGESYSWYPTMGLDDPTSATPTATVNQDMTYTVTVLTADGCEDSQSLGVSVFASPNPSINVWDTDICLGESSQLIAVESSGLGATFSWTPTTGLNNANSNAPVASPSETTTYTVTAIANNGCTAIAEVTLVVDICSAIEEATFVNSLNVYPNPSSGAVYVAFDVAETNTVALQVYNTLGQVLYNEDAVNFAGTYQSQLDLNDFAKGLYYVAISIGGETHFEKIMLH